MRLLIAAATSLAFIASSPNAVRAQEDDLSLINDVEPRADGKNAQQLKNGLRSAIPETLSEALAQALESNPEMLLAEAKLRQAEAELYQAKLKAVQEVTIAYHEYQAKLREHKVHLEANKKVPGSNPAHVIAKMNDETAESEAKLAYLLGLTLEANRAGAARQVETTQRRSQPRIVSEPRETAKTIVISPAKRPEIPEKYRKVLQKPVKVKFAAVPLMEVVDFLNQSVGGELPIVRPAADEFNTDVVVDVELPEEVPLQAALELIADLTGCAFVFRDYGVLVKPDGLDGHEYPRSATIPETPMNPGASGGGFF